MIETPSIQWFPGHMAKTKRLMADSIKHIDVVAELLDARVPLASANPDLKKMIGNKPRVTLLNKSDLADSRTNKEWKSYFEQRNTPCLLMDARSGRGMKDIMPLLHKILEEELARRASKGMSGQAIRMMIVGIPNVGKSSLINRLAGRSVTAVADRPGVTRGEQWVKTEIGLEVLDTAGVLWPKFEDDTVAKHLAFTGAIKDDILDIETLAMLLLEQLKYDYLPQLANRYKFTVEEASEMEGYDLLELVGRKRGMLQAGGHINLERAAITVMDEFRAGMIGAISLERPE